MHAGGRARTTKREDGHTATDHKARHARVSYGGTPAINNARVAAIAAEPGVATQAFSATATWKYTEASCCKSDGATHPWKLPFRATELFAAADG